MSSRPRSIFFGTPEFSVPIAAAADAVTEIVAVVTQPDAPSGRGHDVQASAVKRWAQERGLPVLEPKRLRDPEWLTSIRSLEPEVAVLAAYGKILPPELLAIPPHGFVNIHPSLLPRHRGPSPVAGALMAGDAVTGVTLMILDDQMDHGPIIAAATTDILADEHRPQLEARLANIGAELLKEKLTEFLDGRIPVHAQDHNQATYTNLLKREEGVIDWQQSAELLARRIRALDPWPGTRTTWLGRQCKVLSGVPREGSEDTPIGTVVDNNGQPAVVCGKGQLILGDIQIGGGKSMTASAFARGHRDFIGSRLA